MKPTQYLIAFWGSLIISNIHMDKPLLSWFWFGLAIFNGYKFATTENQND